MAQHANSLTENDKAAIGRRDTPATIPTVPMSDLRVMANGLRQLGYDVDSLLAAAGLADLNLDDPDVRVSCECYGAVLERAQRARYTPNLQLELAKRTPLGAYPLLDYLVLSSDSVGEGLHQLVRYFRLVGSPVLLTIDERSDPIRLEMKGPPGAIEYSVALLALHPRRETEGRYAVATIHFTHVPDDPAGFEKELGCRVITRSSWNGVEIDRLTFEMPLRRRDPILRKILEAQADEVLSKLPQRTAVASEVQRALVERVARGDATIGSIARAMAMSPRTLQRRLSTEGISFQELLDEARKEAAGRYLKDTALAICEVAYLVGYSEPAPFHRAFKRWYGTTPESFRKIKIRL